MKDAAKRKRNLTVTVDPDAIAWFQLHFVSVSEAVNRLMLDLMATNDPTKLNARRLAKD